MDHHELEIDALRALAGADLVQRALLAGLSLGDPSIDALAYAVKCRVKAHEKLVAKVLIRRKDGKHSYRAQDATDIVGLRFLALFRNELPELLRQVLTFFDTAQRAPYNLLVGPDLERTIQEIVIYRNHSMPDTTDQIIVREFERIGFPPIVVPHDKKPGDFKEKAKIVYAPSEYSSIHIVIWASSRRAPKKSRIPVEIQIRTALEDVWGEIDHRLKYKVTGGNPKALNEEGRRQFDLAADQVVTLKRQLDGCSSLADNIYNQMQEIFTRSTYQLTPSRAAVTSVDIERVLELSVGDVVSKKIASIVNDIRKAYSAIGSRTATNDMVAWIETAQSLLKCADNLGECLDSLVGAPLDEETERKASYYLRMEQALCLFWVARIMKLYLAGCAVPIEHGLEGDYLEDALRQYFLLQNDVRFSKDPILAFRIAQALSLRGDDSFALDMYREAVAYLNNDQLPADHYMRVRIPRFLGIVLWNNGENIRRSAVRSRHPELLAERRRHYYLEAIDVTREVVGHPVAPWEGEGGQRGDQEFEDTTTKNNVLDYSICYLKVGGTWEELAEHGVTKTMLNEYLDLLIAPGVKNISPATFADTVRAAASFLGRAELAQAAARRVKRLMKTTAPSLTLPIEALQEMIDDANAELRKARQSREHSSNVKPPVLSIRKSRKGH